MGVISDGTTVIDNGIVDGVIIWDTTPKTAGFTAVVGNGYFVDTTSAGITVTLPSSPSFGDQVAFVDYAGTFNSANKGLAIDLNGNKLNGSTTPSGIAVQYQSCILTFTDATQGWKVTSDGLPSFFSNITISFITPAGSLGTVEDDERSSYTLSSAAATVNFGSLTYSIQSGSLPGGTSLNSTTAAITGTITAVVSNTIYTFTVRATSTLSASVFLDRTFTITVNAPASFVAATGGTITTSGDFKIHTFTGPGTFTVTDAGNALGSNSVDYLVVAGGGGGGFSHAGGGGAGGFRQSFPNPATGGLPVSVQGYPITVGAGGARGVHPSTNPTKGGSSIFSSITSTGGGIGGSEGPSGRPGQPGGSGGGGGAYPQPGGSGGTGNSPPVSPSQGNSGGNGTNRPTAGGGGGGGGAAGGGSTQPNSPGYNGGPGGAGTASTISASPVTYAGGGGGGAWAENGGTGGSGGSGIGGNGGGPGAATSGTTNRGGGGGGGRSASGAGGLGGSGIVVIRYKFQ